MKGRKLTPNEAKYLIVNHGKTKASCVKGCATGVYAIVERSSTSGNVIGGNICRNFNQDF